MNPHSNNDKLAVPGPERPIRTVSFFRFQTKKPVKSTPISPDGLLTSRQKEIVTLITDDLTAKEIGDRMGISPKTVEFHRMLIRQRLGVSGTAGIVRYAIRTGLVQP